MGFNVPGSPTCTAAIVLLFGGLACACRTGGGGYSCAPPMMTIRIGSSSREAGSCPGMYRYLGTAQVKTGDTITVDIPRSRHLSIPALPDSSNPAVVAVVSRSTNGHHEKLKARTAGTASLIVRTPLCRPENFVTTPSPRIVGSKTASGPCRIMRIGVY